jgi:ribonucleoside-triphosphate reductase
MVKKKEVTQKDRTPCEVYSRIVGYLRPVNQWNEGKAAEYQMRKEYSGK